MNAIRLEPPTPFAFHNPDDWPRWKRRFQQFRLASGLAEADPQRQVSTLLYCMGESAEETLNSTKISEEHHKEFDKVIDEFDRFFNVRKNTIFERARFNRRVQGEDESVEHFITDLFSLAENCSYGDMKDEMIRDRIVVGIRDEGLSAKLQLEADLTLETAMRKVRQREAVQEQQEILKTGKMERSTAIEQVHHSTTKPTSRSKPVQRERPKTYTQQPLGTSNSRCTRCGKGPHSKGVCPAKNAICHNCKKKGHYQKQCFSKTTIGEVSIPPSVVPEIQEEAYLNTVNGSNEAGKVWNCVVRVNGVTTSFKLDTGAEVTVVTKETAEHLKSVKKWQKSEKKLCGADRRQLQVLGTFSANLKHNTRSTVQLVYVVKDLNQNLLGLPAIEDLGLIQRIGVVEKRTIPDEFKNVFNGLGTFTGEYHIQITPGARPFALFTARHVPFPLREKVRMELDRMERMGVISKVEQPVEWCAAMVVVPKKSGAIRICVDYHPLNEVVLREVHPLPKVDETLSQLAGATMFSKLDANSGFWQIPLSEESKPLTTFITPFGRYCFNKLPFGISSAPEYFQKRMNQVLAGIDGVVCHMDDILYLARARRNTIAD